MPHDRDRDKTIGAALKAALRVVPEPQAHCPEPDTIAAYVDRSLTLPEVEACEAHFATCARCQDVLAGMARAETVSADDAADVRALPSASSARMSRFRWAVAAPLAAAAVVVLAVWIGTRPGAPDVSSRSVPDETRPAQPPAPEPAREADRLQAAKAAPALPAPRVDEPQTSVNRAETVQYAAPPPELGSTLARSADAGLADRKLAQASPRANEGPPPEPVAEQVAVGRDMQKAKEGQEAIAERKSADEERTAQARPTQERLEAIAPAPAPPPASAAAPSAPAAAARVASGRAAADAAGNLKTDTSALRQRLAAEIVAPGGSPRWRLGVNGSVERSVDLGQSWERQTSGVNTELLAGSCPSSTVCWVVGRAGTVLRTTDAGGRWTRLDFPNAADLGGAVARSAEAAVVITLDGRRFETADGGRTWK